MKKQTRLYNILIFPIVFVGFISLETGLFFQPTNFQKYSFFKNEIFIAKVTAPQKKVTDPVLLKELLRQGIDKDYVELFRDYTPRHCKWFEECSPYAQFYRDRKSGKRFMVVQGLPMVTAGGKKIEPEWYKVGGRYITKNNLFRGIVSDNNVELIVRNNQPGGRKRGNKLSFHAQLFLNGIKQKASGLVLLAVDPINANYHYNVLEWDYGIAKRRLRIIEGHVLGSWIFPANPNGDVRIIYNQSGDYHLKLGKYAVGEDEESVPASIFASAIYPFEVSDTATYYPDANPETASVDGDVLDSITQDTWSVLRGSPGDSADDSTAYGEMAAAISGSTTDKWIQMTRGIVLFDSSGLSDTAVISAATVSLYAAGTGYTGDNLGVTPNINIYSSTPASSTSLAVGDFAQIGSTALSTAVTYATWFNGGSGGYVDFALNDLTVVSKTGVSKFGVRNAGYDVANVAPTWSINTNYVMRAFMSEQGTGYKPKLVVTYTVPSPFDALLLGGD